MSSNDIFLLESYFDFLYARSICSAATEVLKQMCDGCRSWNLSQQTHSCLLMPKAQRLELYFQDILDTINEKDIVIQWTEAVDTLNDIPTGLIYLFKLKIGCKDWRATQMKTEVWKIRMLKMAKTLIFLEQRLMLFFSFSLNFI